MRQDRWTGKPRGRWTRVALEGTMSNIFGKLKMTATARLGALAALTVLLCGAARAQNPPPVPAAEAVTPRKLQLANELIEATGVNAQIKNMFHTMAGQMAANAGSKLSADDKTKMQVIFDAEGDALAKRFPEIEDAAARDYAETYSEQEISDILAFYKSPSGRAMTAKAPQLMQGMIGAVLKMMPEVQRDAGMEICAKITCTPAQKAAFMGEAPPKP
jgi:hypothetical protein